MSNEWLFLLCAAADLLFVFAAARLGREWLLCSIIANLTLIVVFGAKLVPVFGFITNAGNIFYACVFFATHFLLERYGRYEGLKTIWLGAGVIMFFVAMSQFAVQFTGAPASSTANDASSLLFSFAPRVFIGSIVAYTIAQYINVTLFVALARFTGAPFLWLRANGANGVAQLADSVIFFSIVFWGLPADILLQTILLGWATKVAVVALGTPLMYIDTALERSLPRRELTLFR